MQSPQYIALLATFEVTTKAALLRAIRDDLNRECREEGEPAFTLLDAELQLDSMLNMMYESMA